MVSMKKTLRLLLKTCHRRNLTSAFKSSRKGNGSFIKKRRLPQFGNSLQCAESFGQQLPAKAVNTELNQSYWYINKSTTFPAVFNQPCLPKTHVTFPALLQFFCSNLKAHNRSAVLQLFCSASLVYRCLEKGCWKKASSQRYKTRW